MVVVKLFVYLSAFVLMVQSQIPDQSQKIKSFAEYPYLVTFTNNGLHYCSGAVVDHAWLVTAAHCIKPQWQRTTVLHFGTLSSNTSRMVRRIMKSYAHPIEPIKSQLTSSNANNATLNNIGLIKFDQKLKYGKTVHNIEIEGKSIGFEQYTGQCVGYGKMCDGDAASTDARYVSFKIVKQDAYVLFREGELKGRKGAVSCKCDSGGPFVMGKKLIAITVCGQNCDEESKKLSNTMLRVTPFAKWISYTLKNHGSRYTPTSVLISIVLYLPGVL